MARYVYEHVLVLRVIDADTLVIDQDFGQNIWRRNTRLRLAHINAPELPTEAGQAAAAYLTMLLSPWDVPPVVTLETLKDREDNYGRLLGVVITASGVNVNEAMVASGHAVPYP
jgi:endonuclease YncB( thermonuclease family)